MLTGIDIEGNELSLNIFLVMSGKLKQVGPDSRKKETYNVEVSSVIFSPMILTMRKWVIPSVKLK